MKLPLSMLGYEEYIKSQIKKLKKRPLVYLLLSTGDVT